MADSLQGEFLNIMKKLLLILSFLTVLFTACSNDGQETQESIAKTHDEEMILKLRENPKLLFSKSFNKINLKNGVTKTKGIFFFEKSSGENSKIIITRGLYYSGGDCATWGTIIHDDVSGATVFQPASAATQLLMNVCGLSKVARMSN
jgi:hypothetical protein